MRLSIKKFRLFMRRHSNNNLLKSAFPLDGYGIIPTNAAQSAAAHSMCRHFIHKMPLVGVTPQSKTGKAGFAPLSAVRQPKGLDLYSGYDTLISAVLLPPWGRRSKTRHMIHNSVGCYVSYQHPPLGRLGGIVPLYTAAAAPSRTAKGELEA